MSIWTVDLEFDVVKCRTLHSQGFTFSFGFAQSFLQFGVSWMNQSDRSMICILHFGLLKFVTFKFLACIFVACCFLKAFFFSRFLRMILLSHGMKVDCGQNVRLVVSLKTHINPYTPQVSMPILLTAFHTLHIFKFPKLSRTSGLFPDTITMTSKFSIPHEASRSSLVNSCR